MLSFAILVCLVTVAVGMTTHRPHHMNHMSHASHHHGSRPTKVPQINENFYFHAEKNMLAVKHGRDCYIYELNPQEEMDIKTSHGLHTIEKNIIDIVDMGLTAGVAMAIDQLLMINPRLAHYCGKYQIMKIN